MSERLRRARRVLAVQAQLDRLAEWSLIDIKAQAAALEDTQRNLICFMSEESAVAGLFSTLMIHKLQAVAEKLATLVKEQEVQKARQLDERRRLRHAGRMVAKLESDEQRKDAACQLAEAIEAVLQRRS